MGCITSKTETDNTGLNLFEAVNVDHLFRHVISGHLEVNETHIVFHIEDRAPFNWPIKTLRRYACDQRMFSFECGRRCPTGEGCYTFECSCRKCADKLYRLLQRQARNLASEDRPEIFFFSNSTDVNMMDLRSSLPTSRLHNRHSDGYLEPAPLHLRQNGKVRKCRLSSAGSCSNGSVSPTSPSPLQVNTYVNIQDGEVVSSQSYANTTDVSTPLLSNNGVPAQEELVTSQSYINTTDVRSPSIKEPSTIMTTGDIDAQTSVDKNSPNLNSDLTCLETESGPQHTTESNEIAVDPLSAPSYINIIQEGDEEAITEVLKSPPRPLSNIDFESDERHCYANLDPSELEGLWRRSRQISVMTLNYDPPPCSPREHYLALDLKQNDGQPVNLMKPTIAPKGYSMIDFNKTFALLALHYPSLHVDEGSRKTRHNSTINDETEEKKKRKRTRHNSTISELIAPFTSRLSSSLNY